MSAVVIEHENVADLPETWRAKLAAPRTAQVTVRIETEESAVAPDAGGFVTSDPLCRSRNHSNAATCAAFDEKNLARACAFGPCGRGWDNLGFPAKECAKRGSKLAA